jgi:diguanylate cyclase (GGDEF)-like protein
MAMNRNDPQTVQSNRPLSRRLHRRPALAAAPACAVGAHHPGRVATTVVGLPQTVIRAAGMLELQAAEMRIAALEEALLEARAAASTDPLTGALNRRGFAAASGRELARLRRSAGRIALAHIDLDDFKRVNDRLGHQAGDDALVHLVDVLHKAMRPSDVLCRFGGEEFVLLFPDTGLEDAAAALSRFQRAFSAQAIPGTDCVMTFSAGVVAKRADESLEAAIQRADAATYAAKRAGKNRIVAA